MTRRPVVLAVLVVAGLGMACDSGGGSSSAKPVEPVPDPEADPAAEAGAEAEADPAAEAGAEAEAEMAPPLAERVLWEAAPNRHLAHRTVDGDLVVDAGSPGFARYTRFGLPRPRWRLGARVDGQPVAIPSRGGASVDLPLTADQAAAARALQLRVHAAAPGALAIKLDGRALGRVELALGWQTITLPADGRWHEGEHQVVLESRLGDDLAVRWLRVAAGEPAAAADPLHAAGHDAVTGGLLLRDGAGLAWYVLVPADATLVGDVEGACAVEVLARGGDGARVGGRLEGRGARVSLAPLAGRVVRLDLRAVECADGGVVRARVVAPGTAAPPPDGPPPRYVVLWIMDTLRADRVPAFGLVPGFRPGPAVETPAFDRLAAAGAAFRGHYVGGTESQESHASMWTSLYPVRHGVRTAGNDKGYRIGKDVPVLARVLGELGWYSIGVTGNGFVGDYGGYARGFDEYRNLMREKGWRNGVIFGANMLDDALARLDRHRARAPDQPALVFVGTIDTHSPLVGRAPWLDRYDPGPYDGPFRRGTTAGPLGLVPGVMGCSKVPPPREIQRMRAIYDSAVSYQDALVGDLLAALEQRGIADETMIVITSDHGEELFEEDRCGHGASLRESITRVPLLVHYPPRVPARAVDEGTEGIDVLPTILDAIGAPPPAWAQGRSLRGLAAGDGAGWAQPAVASQHEYAFAMRLGAWKARVGRTGRPLVFDLVADPLERQDLSATRPVERRFLTDHLGFYLAHRDRWTKATWGVVSRMTEAGAAALEADE